MSSRNFRIRRFCFKQHVDGDFKRCCDSCCGGDRGQFLAANDRIQCTRAHFELRHEPIRGLSSLAENSVEVLGNRSFRLSFGHVHSPILLAGIKASTEGRRRGTEKRYPVDSCRTHRLPPLAFALGIPSPSPLLTRSGSLSPTVASARPPSTGFPGDFERDTAQRQAMYRAGISFYAPLTPMSSWVI